MKFPKVAFDFGKKIKRLHTGSFYIYKKKDDKLAFAQYGQVELHDNVTKYSLLIY